MTNPVKFADIRLEEIIRCEIGKLEGEIFPEDMEGIKRLRSSRTKLRNLTGIEYAKNLESLYISSCNVKDISPIKNLPKLKYVNISNNKIGDLSPIGTLQNLNVFKCYDNPVNKFFMPNENKTKRTYYYLLNKVPVVRKMTEKQFKLLEYFLFSASRRSAEYVIRKNPRCWFLVREVLSDNEIIEIIKDELGKKDVNGHYVNFFLSLNNFFFKPEVFCLKFGSSKAKSILKRKVLKNSLAS